MASGQTSIYHLPYPLSTDPVNVHNDVKALTDRLEVVFGNLSSIPSQIGQNGKFLKTDGYVSSWAKIPNPENYKDPVDFVYYWDHTLADTDLLALSRDLQGLPSGSRILLTDQINPEENGIYTFTKTSSTTYTMLRSSDQQTPAIGDFTTVKTGKYKGRIFTVSKVDKSGVYFNNSIYNSLYPSAPNVWYGTSVDPGTGVATGWINFDSGIEKFSFNVGDALTISGASNTSFNGTWTLTMVNSWQGPGNRTEISFLIPALDNLPEVLVNSDSGILYSIDRVNPLGIVWEFPLTEDDEPDKILTGDDINLISFRNAGLLMSGPRTGFFTRASVENVQRAPDVLDGNMIVYAKYGNVYWGDVSWDWTIDVRWDETTPLLEAVSTNPYPSASDTGPSPDPCITIVVVAASGFDTGICSDFMIDGVSQTVAWQGGSSPTSGTQYGYDVYTYVVYPNGGGGAYVLGSCVSFS